MDSITQFALGASLAEAMLGKEYGKKAVLMGGVLGTLPDLDVLSIPLFSAVENFVYHRGASHAFFYQFIFSFFVAWFWIWLIKKKQRARKQGGLPAKEESSLPRLKIWLTVLLCFLTHSIIDMFTVYGTKIWLPFSDRPVTTSNMFIIDPLFSLPIVITVLLAFTLGASKRRAFVMLGLLSLYTIWSLTAVQITKNKVETALERQNLSFDKILLTPTIFNTVVWRIIVIDKDNYYEAFYSFAKPLEGDIEFKILPRNLALLDASRGAAIQGNKSEFDKLTWFSGGFYKLKKTDAGIVFIDLRFGQSEPKEFYSFAFLVSVFGTDENESLRFLDEAQIVKVNSNISFQDLKNWFKKKLF